MKDLDNSTTQIDGYDFGSWCNCSNFPFNKCDECKVLMGDLKHLGYEETLILKQ